MNNKYTKWVACWGNATSITDRKEATFAKDITLRYPVRIVFNGSALRFRFSNLTGTEPVTLTRVFIAKQGKDYRPVPVTFNAGSSPSPLGRAGVGIRMRTVPRS